MLYCRQHIIADRIRVITFFIIKLFGLWPYKFKISSHQIELNFLSITYSIFVPGLMIFGYLYLGSVLYSEGVNGKQRSKAFATLPLQMIVVFYSYLVIISYLILCAGQHFLHKKKKNAYYRCKKVADCMREYRTECVDIQEFVIKFLCKTLVYDSLNFALLLYNLSSASETIRSHPYLSIFIYLPIYCIRLNTNVFYGGILFFNVMYRQLNQNLNRIFRLPKTQNVRAEEFSNLNIEFEKAWTLHFEIAEAIEAFNSLFSVQIILWILTQLILVITQFFYQYIAVVQLIAMNESYFVGQNFTILTSIFMALYELFTTTFACNSLVREVIYLNLIRLQIVAKFNIFFFRLKNLQKLFIK